MLNKKSLSYGHCLTSFSSLSLTVSLRVIAEKFYVQRFVGVYWHHFGRPKWMTGHFCVDKQMRFITCTGEITKTIFGPCIETFRTLSNAGYVTVAIFMQWFDRPQNIVIFWNGNYDILDFKMNQIVWLSELKVYFAWDCLLCLF